MTPHPTLQKILEKVLQNRIKIIGEDEQTYTGTPNELIDELSAAFSSLLQDIEKKLPKKYKIENNHHSSLRIISQEMADGYKVGSNAYRQKVLQLLKEEK